MKRLLHGHRRNNYHYSPCGHHRLVHTRRRRSPPQSTTVIEGELSVDTAELRQHRPRLVSSSSPSDGIRGTHLFCCPPSCSSYLSSASPFCSGGSASRDGTFRSTPVRLALVAVEGAAAPSVNTASFIQARQWTETPYWCDLCKEPINGWNEHRGKREHICLEMFYERIVSGQERQWDPLSVMQWQRYFVDVTKTSLDSFADHYEVSTCELERRMEILTLTKYLIDNEMLFVGKKFKTSVFSKEPVGFLGAVLMYKMHFAPLIKMFPYADAKEISCLTQMVSGQYNLEGVFDLVGFREVIPPSELSRLDNSDRVAGGLYGMSGGAGPAATSSSSRLSSSCSGGIEGQKSHTMPTKDGEGGNNNAAEKTEEGKDKKDQTSSNNKWYVSADQLPPSVYAGTPAMRGGSLPDLTFSQKSAFIRSILGQLRWAVEEDTTLCPFPTPPPPHLLVLCQRLANMVLTELIALRTTEYIARVEGVWREHSAQKNVSPPSQTEAPPLPTSNSGITAYYENKLHSTEYEAMLNSDVTKVHRAPMYFLHDLQRGKRRQLGASSDAASMGSPSSSQSEQ